jgi:ATP-dependent DNA helicase RecG
VLSSTAADIPFFKMIVEEESRSGRPISLDALILLSHLRLDRRIDVSEAARAIQKNDVIARSLLERLVEMGIAEPQGLKKGRTYMLSASIYRQLGQSADYIRQAGFDRIQQEQMVVQYIQRNGRIVRKEVMELCRLTKDQSGHLLRDLVARQKIISNGQGRATFYTIPAL